MCLTPINATIALVASFNPCSTVYYTTLSPYPVLRVYTSVDSKATTAIRGSNMAYQSTNSE